AGFSPAIAGDDPSPAMFVTDKADGTGLGLSIVRTIVERHRGTLTFDRDGTFSTIAILELPIAGDA
ncbi:MAG: ATP-binding protein, partial [Alkalispirochaeta sp.]